MINMSIFGVSMAATFIGMTTVGAKRPPFTLTDHELVKRDLLNHFSTRKGEVMGIASYGTIMHDLVMDQLDNFTRSLILEDVENVINSDPRVSLNGAINIVEYDNGIRIELDIYYIPFDSSELLYLDFKKNTSNQSQGF